MHFFSVPRMFAHDCRYKYNSQSLLEPKRSSLPFVVDLINDNPLSGPNCNAIAMCVC